MRVARCIGLGIVALGVAVGVAADHHEGDLMAEVEAIGDKLAETMVAGDLETALEMYLDDAISLPNMGPRLDGKDAFREQHAQMEAMGMKIESFDSQPTDVWEAGDHVIEIGTYEISMNMGGMPIDDKGKYMTVYVRGDDGSLKIKVETWNTDMNPMAMGAPSE